MGREISAFNCKEKERETLGNSLVLGQPVTCSVNDFLSAFKPSPYFVPLLLLFVLLIISRLIICLDS